MENINAINTPADEIASTTPATETTGESVTEQAPTTNADNTPVSETVTPDTVAKQPYVVEQTWPGLECHALKELDDPAELFTSTVDTEPSTDPETTSITDPASVTPGLPDGYLANGYHAVSDKGHKYLRPEFVGDHAEFIARNLAPMKAADFNKLLKELKRAKKTTLPYEARQTALLELVPASIALVGRKRAPSLLTAFIRANVDHIHGDEDYNSFYRHASAIGAFLVAMEGGE